MNPTFIASFQLDISRYNANYYYDYRCCHSCFEPSIYSFCGSGSYID